MHSISNATLHQHKKHPPLRHSAQLTQPCTTKKQLRVSSQAPEHHIATAHTALCTHSTLHKHKCKLAQVHATIRATNTNREAHRTQHFDEQMPPTNTHTQHKHAHTEQHTSKHAAHAQAKRFQHAVRRSLTRICHLHANAAGSAAILVAKSIGDFQERWPLKPRNGGKRCPGTLSRKQGSNGFAYNGQTTRRKAHRNQRLRQRF